MAKYPKYKVAAVQAAPVYLDLDASVDKAIGFIKEAADQGVKLIGFPEGYLPGYPWFAFLGRALDYVPRFYHKLYLNAVECPSSAMVKSVRQPVIMISSFAWVAPRKTAARFI